MQRLRRSPPGQSPRSTDGASAKSSMSCMPRNSGRPRGLRSAKCSPTEETFSWRRSLRIRDCWVHRKRSRGIAAASASGRARCDLEQRRVGADRDALLHLLNDEALHDDEYLLAACLPLVLSDIAQRAFAFFAHDEHRTDMEGFVVRIDEEAAPTMRYSDASLLPTLGGGRRVYHSDSLRPGVTAQSTPCSRGSCIQTATA